jgi:TonB family protein
MRPDTPKECEFQAVAAPRVEDFYPAASQRIGEEGPVELAFKLEDAKGWARDISVVGSSLSERLGQAAVQYLSNAIFSTPCPGTRYEAQVVFWLTEWGQLAPSKPPPEAKP